MDQHKIDMFIVSNKKYFPQDKIMFLREGLEMMNESDFWMLAALEFKDPTTVFLISLFFGALGIDRFMIGDTGMGVLKLLTGGLCGILTLIDWITISNETKERNLDKVMELL